MRLNAKQLREVEENEVKERLTKVKRHPIYFILENVYDTYNVGGLFRLADAIGVAKMYLCGEMEIPPNHRIKKASIGTYKVVDWKYCHTAKEAIDDLNSKFKILNSKRISPITKNQSPITIVAVEQHSSAVSYTRADYRFPLALIFGNETSGILPQTLKLADQIVEIPMWGINKSLNVIVSAAIVSYWVMQVLNSQIYGREKKV